MRYFTLWKITSIDPLDLICMAKRTIHSRIMHDIQQNEGKVFIIDKTIRHRTCDLQTCHGSYLVSWWSFFFYSMLVEACKLFVPAGCIPKIKPNFPLGAAKLADTIDQLCQNNPSGIEITRIDTDIFKLVSEHKKA